MPTAARVPAAPERVRPPHAPPTPHGATTPTSSRRPAEPGSANPDRARSAPARSGPARPDPLRTAGSRYRPPAAPSAPARASAAPSAAPAAPAGAPLLPASTVPAAPVPAPTVPASPVPAPAVPAAPTVPAPAASAPAGVLAVTTDAGTALGAEVGSHPRRDDVEAHEDVHRRQVAARGRRPVGTRVQVEAEARRGAQVLRHGGAFEPVHAAPEEPLGYEHASAGPWLLDFVEFLRDTTSYDVEAVDWEDAVDALLASERVVHTAATMTAIELSDRMRHRFLVEVFSQELDEVGPPPVSPDPVPPGLTVPTTQELEDALFEDYLPLLDASMFAAADVSAEGPAFIEHWLDRLETIRLVPEAFDITAYAPPDRSAEVASEREAALERFMAVEVPDLMFMFMLDEFARSVGGPEASVAGAPLIVGGGEYRTITPEHWLATLDMEQYRERLVTHLSGEFDRRLRTDRAFRRLLISAADQRSRFASLLLVHLAIAGHQDDLDDALENIPVLSIEELEQFEDDLFSFPAETYERLAAAQTATTAFYAALRPGLDNDAALLTAVDALVDALHKPGEHEAVGALLRVVTLAGSFKTLVEQQVEAATARIGELVEVSYEQIAADIAEMATFAATYLEQTWIPKLHEVALRRITANYEALCERRDNWDVFTADTIANLTAGATIFTDVAETLEDGTYESVTLEDQVITADDAYRLRDAAAVMQAEADALSDPETNSERYAELLEAIGGFEDVKGRIERGEVDPNLYGPEVLADAKSELGLDTFQEYTTYADVLFGRAVAGRNPFLARLVVTWKYLEIVDDAVQGILIFAALGLLTIASLLVGALGAVAAMIMFAIDATLSIGMGVHQVNAADALLELVRLDLDQSVTGITVEQAENALMWAWIGLALSVVLTVGGLALGVALRYGTAAGESLGISLRYFRLAVEQPELFSSLRAIVRDPVRLSRLLDLAGDALDLEILLHRMDSVLDLGRAERLLDLAGDAARVNRMLDVGHDAAAVESALTQLTTGVPNRAWRIHLLDGAADDVVSLADLVGHADDLPQLSRLLDDVPADQLLAIARHRPLTDVEAMLARGVRAEDLGMGVGAPGGGLGPATVDPRVALPADVATLLRGVGADASPVLTTATAHEANRLRTVLSGNGFPGKAGPEVPRVAGAWAAEGIERPLDFVNRWEYARMRFIEIEAELARTGVAVPAGMSRRRMAADALVAEIRAGTVTADLATESGLVRSLAGRGFTHVGGTTADEVVGGLRENARALSFGDETSTAYHVHKHGDELPAVETPAGGGFEAMLSAYVGGARRTVAGGTVRTAEIVNGTGPVTFVRVVREADGTRVEMTALVYVREGRGVISSYQGKVLGP